MRKMARPAFTQVVVGKIAEPARKSNLIEDGFAGAGLDNYGFQRFWSLSLRADLSIKPAWLDQTDQPQQNMKVRLSGMVKLPLRGETFI
jgi:hypothetical protein